MARRTSARGCASPCSATRRERPSGVMQWAEEAPTGVFAWDELYAADVDAAARFYGTIAGWTASPTPVSEGYRLLNAGDTSVAGLMAKPDELPAAAWGLYFAVEDVDAGAAARPGARRVGDRPAGGRSRAWGATRCSPTRPARPLACSRARGSFGSRAVEDHTVSGRRERVAHRRAGRRGEDPAPVAAGWGRPRHRLDRLRAAAERSDRQWALAAVERCDGVLAGEATVRFCSRRSIPASTSATSI